MSEKKDLDLSRLEEILGGLNNGNLPQEQADALKLLIRAHKLSGSTLEDVLNLMTTTKTGSDSEISIKDWKDYVRAYWDYVHI